MPWIGMPLCVLHLDGSRFAATGSRVCARPEMQSCAALAWSRHTPSSDLRGADGIGACCASLLGQAGVGLHLDQGDTE